MFSFCGEAKGKEHSQTKAEFDQALGQEDWARTEPQEERWLVECGLVKAQPQLPWGTRELSQSSGEAEASIGRRGLSKGKNAVLGYVPDWEQTETAGQC